LFKKLEKNFKAIVKQKSLYTSRILKSKKFLISEQFLEPEMYNLIE